MDNYMVYKPEGLIMNRDRGTLFLAFTGIVFIVLIIALVAAVVTSPQRPIMYGDDEAPLLGTPGDQPGSAGPLTKYANYPGISTTYKFSSTYPRNIGYILGPFASIQDDAYGDKLILNDDGTVTITLTKYGKQLSAGKWHKVEGKGHSVYFIIGDAYLKPDSSCTIFPFEGTIDIVNQNGLDYLKYKDNDCIGGSYNGWDAGYATMDASSDVLNGYIDACIPADVARPFVEQGLTGKRAVPYILFDMPVDTTEYFVRQGISADLCGPYYAAGVSREDTIAYLDSGFTADQIMPYVLAGVPESEVLAYLSAGFTYDRVKPFIDAKVPESDTLAYLGAGVTYAKAKPYIDANAPASMAISYAASSYSFEQCMPFVNAGIEISKARPFMLFKIPSDQAIVYIENSISASAAKPYVDAGVPAEKAVDEIRQGIPPTVSW